MIYFSPILPRRATGYEKRSDGYVNAPYLDMSIPYAAGSLYSTAEDLYRWDQALYTDKLLSASGKATIYTPYLDKYAYGWTVVNIQVGQLKDSLLLITHGGGINGFNTMISRLPKDKQLVVLLNNTGGAPLGDIRENIVNILYNQPVKAPKKSIADILRQSVLTEPIEKTRQKFSIWKADKAYSLNEGDINSLGYTFLQEGKLTEAITVFTLNVESFPNSDNVYDSRGEAYMKAGNKAAAIQDYKKIGRSQPPKHGWFG